MTDFSRTTMCLEWKMFYVSRKVKHLKWTFKKPLVKRNNFCLCGESNTLVRCEASHDTVWDTLAPTISFSTNTVLFDFIVENISSVICNSFDTITSLSLQAVVRKPLLFILLFFFFFVLLVLLEVIIKRYFGKWKLRIKKRDSEIYVEKRTI